MNISAQVAIQLHVIIYESNPFLFRWRLQMSMLDFYYAFIKNTIAANNYGTTDSAEQRSFALFGSPRISKINDAVKMSIFEPVQPLLIVS